MTDNAMGWLDRIVDFDLGGSDWILIETRGAINAFVSVRMGVDLTSSAGGTPGFVMFDGTGVGGGQAGYLLALRAIATADLHRHLTTLAGLGLTGFGFYDATPFAIPLTQLYIKLDHQMPSDTFRLNVSVDFTLDVGASLTDRMRVSTIKGRDMVAGGPSGFVDTKAAPAPHFGATVLFRVNPSTLQVTL